MRAAALALCLLDVAAAEPDANLRRFGTEHYEIHTNLTRAEAMAFGRHMELVYAEYAGRFAVFQSAQPEPMPLYLFRTEEQYQAFLGGYGISAAHTGGIFFVQAQGRGLATWTRGRSRSQTLAVLQHEGFHQFAHAQIGPHLPLWINEGLAQFFEDGIFVRGNLVLGQRHERRIVSVRNALRTGTAISFDQMLATTSDQWQAAVAGGGLTASLMYDQAWSMVYYLVRTSPKRQEAFQKYLERLHHGEDPAEAFRAVFGRNTATFRRAWEQFALVAQPDTLNTAVSRLEFLGQGLRVLQDRGDGLPRTLNQLEALLKRLHFKMRVQGPGLTLEYDATDRQSYEFTRANGSTGRFVLAPSADATLPPRITAEGLVPSPSLVWSRDDEGGLVSEVQYR